MRKRVLSIALCLCMVLTLLPTLSIPVAASGNNTTLTVGDVTLIDPGAPFEIGYYKNGDSDGCPTGTAEDYNFYCTYDEGNSSAVLYLNNAVIEGQLSTDEIANFKVQLTGDNIVENDWTAIYFDGRTIIDGDGSLTVSSYCQNACGISAGGSLTINADVNVSAVSTDYGSAYGISANGLNITRGEVTVSAVGSTTSSGIKSQSGNNSITRGTVNAYGSTYGFEGFSVDLEENSDIESVTAIGGVRSVSEGTSLSIASVAIANELCAKNVVCIKGDSVTACDTVTGSLDLSNIPANSGVTYDSGEKKLTLDGAYLTGGVTLPHGATVETKGFSVVTDFQTADSTSASAIVGNGDLTLTGKGTLLAVAAASGAAVNQEDQANASGISARGNLTVDMTGRLMAVGAASGASGSDDRYVYGYGLQADENLNLEGGTVIPIGYGTRAGVAAGSIHDTTAKNGVKLIGLGFRTGRNGTGCGLCANGSSSSVWIQNSARVTVLGGALSEMSGTANAYGIEATSQVGVSGGTVNSFAGKTPTSGNSYGIYVMNPATAVSVSVSGGVVTTRGGRVQGGVSCGISVETDSSHDAVVSVTGGTLNASCGTSNSGNPTGIWVHSDSGSADVSVSGGTLKVKSPRWGIYASGNTESKISVSGGTVLVRSDRYVLHPADPANITNGTALVSTNNDGDGAVDYTDQNLDSYSYFSYPKPIPHTLTVYSDGVGASTGGSYVQGTAVSINAGTKTGYTFDRWESTSGGVFGSASSASTTYTMPDNNAIVTAHWTANPSTYTVTFANGGGTGTDPTQAATAAGGTFAMPANPYTRTGYTFSGWNDGTTTYQVGATYTMPARNVTLTAQWTANGGSNPGGSGSGSGSSTTTTTADPVYVDGTKYDIGKQTVSGDKTTVTVDQPKLQAQIDKATDSVLVPVGDKTNTAVAQLVIKNVEDMAKKDMTLSVQTGDVTYQMPTTAMDTKKVMTELGATNPADVPANVTITNLKEGSVTTDKGTVVLNPVEFTVTATYNGKTAEVERFSQYVQRIIETPAGYDSSKITTAIRTDDGEHVPTNVYQKNGKYYATINSLTNSTYVLIFNQQSFADASGKWYEAAADEMASRCVIFGRTNGKFDGEANVTRAEFAAIIVRALGLPEEGSSNFSDVSGTSWCAGAIGAATEYGIIYGYGDGTFRPDKNITRQEAMAMVQRAAKVAEFTGNSGSLAAFSDADEVGAWAKDAVEFNVGSGLIVGKSNETLAPLSEITRAETAVIVLRLLQKAELVDVRATV